MIGLSSLLTAEFTRDEITGIVTDSSTGLEWQDNTLGTRVSWQSAIDTCESLSLGSHEDWRLPNIIELSSLVDDTKYAPSIDDIFSFTQQNGTYWSSTSFLNARYAWYVNFATGVSLTYAKFTNNINTYRCVRAGA